MDVSTMRVTEQPRKMTAETSKQEQMEYAIMLHSVTEPEAAEAAAFFSCNFVRISSAFCSRHSQPSWYSHVLCHSMMSGHPKLDIYKKYVLAPPRQCDVDAARGTLPVPPL